MSLSWTELIRAGGPASGACGLFALGVYGGQYAVKFKPPFDDYASWGCLTLMTAGTIIAIPQIGVVAYRSLFTTAATPEQKK